MKIANECTGFDRQNGWSPVGHTLQGIDHSANHRDRCALLLDFIHGIADYDKQLHEVVATEENVRELLFGKESVNEALIAECNGEAVAFAVCFHNFSTFMGRRGLYLEDLFVKPEFRRQGIGKKLLVYLTKIAVNRGCSCL
ncbi:uncharacterized protein METZ01_LOCUS255225 [marine metagenome]|uniref:N-acetyltransferase domain-containing protein n=1 Tax=marine metagenome TaxID=408172 RepID=A0A382IUT1_9ZZZZ